jgi:hypothetical protein
MCAMIAITVNPMKLFTNKLWNSCASDSVKPDRDDLSFSLAMLLTSVCVTAHAQRGEIVATDFATGVPTGFAGRTIAALSWPSRHTKHRLQHWTALPQVKGDKVVLSRPRSAQRLQ